MPEVLSDNYARLPLKDIHVDRGGRQRTSINTDGLRGSISVRGVLNPIIVERETGPEGKHRLVAGERRLQACTELQLLDIPVRFADTLSPVESKIIELEENLKRLDLTWQDAVKATQTIHSLYQSQNPTWTQDQTATSLSVSKATISMYLRVAPELEANERVASATSIREAYNILSRRDERERHLEIDRLVHNAPPIILKMHTTRSVNEAGEIIEGEAVEIKSVPSLPPPETYDYSIDENPSKNILHESFLQWAPKYRGPAFNFIHCDFPYGIDVFQGPQAGGERHFTYDDSKEVHFKLLETLLIHLDRIASQSCHVMYWFSMQHYDEIRRMVAELAPDLIIQTHPIIWHKTDQSGIASDPWHGPRHIYETALLMVRGKRKIVQVMSDAYDAPTDRQWHIHTKPEPMLKHFFTMFVDHTTSMLDPTCGSGSAIRAAEALGATSVLGMDIDESTVAQARTALRHFRALRTGISRLSL